MTAPDKSSPMVGGRGPRGYITMGGMFTLLKVREAGAPLVDLTVIVTIYSSNLSITV